MAQYLPLLLLLVLTAGFGAISIFMSRILMPSRPTAAKVMPYESGIIDIHEQPERFPVRFFLVAMIFVVFDVEIIFFYPFTMIYRELGGYGLAAIVIFSAAVFESFLYLISNGALDWGPAKNVRRSLVMLSKDRNSETTIRRVGANGREILESTDDDDDTNREVA